MEIVYEKLVAYESEGNGRITWKKNGDQRVIENKEKTKSVCKDFLRAKCNHGKRCNRLHICKYFLTGSCNKSSCLFDHVSICSVFMSGRCFGCDKYHVFIPKSFSRLFFKPQAKLSHGYNGSTKNLTKKNRDRLWREACPVQAFFQLEAPCTKIITTWLLWSSLGCIQLLPHIKD